MQEFKGLYCVTCSLLLGYEKLKGSGLQEGKELLKLYQLSSITYFDIACPWYNLVICSTQPISFSPIANMLGLNRNVRATDLIHAIFIGMISGSLNNRLNRLSVSQIMEMILPQYYESGTKTNPIILIMS